MESKTAAPAIDKMLTIVELLTGRNEGYSYNEISRLTGIPLNTAYRICLELEKKNYLIKENDRLYIGPSFYPVGCAAKKRMSLVNVARPFLKELNQLSNETVHLDILTEEMDMILVDQVETTQNIKMSVTTGTRAYLHASGFGKCLLAYNDYEAYPAEKLVPLSPNTITDRAGLKAECEKIRELGYAIDNEEYMEGIYCIGAPIFDNRGKCVAALGIMYLKYRYDSEKERIGIDAVKKAAENITKLL